MTFNRRGFPLRVIFAVLAATAFAHAGANLSSNQQVLLAGEGRHDEMAAQLEAQAQSSTLRTADRHSLCYAYSKLKRYDDLLKCLDALATSAQGRDKRTWLFGLDDVTPAIALMRAEALIDLGQLEQARTQADAALLWYQKFGNSAESDILIEALTLAGIAAALDGEDNLARTFRERLQKVSAGGLLESGRAGTKAIALARLNLALGDFQKAYAALTENGNLALESFLDKLVHGRSDRLNWVWLDIPVAFLINKSLFGLGRFAQARAGYDALIALPQMQLNGGISWLVFLDRGLIAEQDGHGEQAMAFYRRAIEAIESQRSTINTEAAKIGFSGNRQAPYDRMVDLLCSAGRLEECFEFMERAKSRALVDLLASRKLSDFPRQDDPRWVDIQPLLLRSEQLDRQILMQSPLRSGEVASRESLVKQKKVTDNAVRQTAPEIAAMLSVSAVGFKDLRPYVAPSETLVQYFVTNAKVFGIVVTSGSVNAAELGIDGAALRRSVEAMRTAIERKSPDAVVRAAELYRWLIKPLEAYLSPQGNLLILPHGILHSVPFAALFDGKQFLVDRYAIRVLPSASVLTQLKRRSNSSPGVLLAIGNPQGNLPGAEEEARLLSRAFAGSLLLLREQATVGAFTASAPRHRLIHLAAHAGFDKIQLAASATAPGMLTKEDVYRLTLNADLVTLSACSSGLGTAHVGDELLGLPREFLVAGASSVVSSLWDVEDDATALLMTNFYFSLGSKNKRDALREAQLAIKQKLPHPFYWSAFYLTGRFD